MARPSLYSRSPARAAGTAPAAAVPAADAAAGTASTGTATASDPDRAAAQRPPPLTFVQRLHRRERWLWAGAMLLLALLAGWPAWTAKIQRPLGIAQIDAALRESIAKEPLVAPGLAAYEAILPSVVRVVGESTAAPAKGAAAPGRSKSGKPVERAPDPEEADPMDGRSVGTGVVIVDKGLILTNLHVVEGAARLTVTFADGSQSEARVVSLQPQNDLAVLQALTIPDDLQAATMRSTSGLAPGDAVLAVGFPFGIGPSASQGVVSGLKREFRSPEGRRILTNLIQFDAAANPGNSGGPLVTMDGHVVGIVTAIMNPNEQRTFIGIGFAVPIENAAAGAGLPPF
ncbi:MAG: hypothetical protein A3E25_12575 [Burkholderiales bacterium RIFCSPHIGHO2_12_FULL_69_20]|nr:MAG: hypothetical protein A3E25_12575 [Burkholderiales bacterium RIFCSPHIGHO2_12_FULL_69_20]